jgi:hypothetical protein
MGDPTECHGERNHDRDDERPFTHRDFERAVAIIRAAGDEITSVRDASLAFRGIREQLAIMTRVFATSVAIAIGCFRYLFLTTNELAKAVTRLDERFAGVDKRFDAVDKRFDAVDKRFDAIDTRLDALTAAVGRLQPPQKQTSLE